MARNRRGEAARILPGPPFDSQEFADYLAEQVSGHGVEIVVATIDAGVVPLAQIAPAWHSRGITVFASTAESCARMADKLQANQWFEEIDLPVPGDRGWPRLAKPRFGASSRGHFILADQAELDFWSARDDASQFVVQDLVRGTEYSVDAYVSRRPRAGGSGASGSRVSGGEVMVACTRHCEPVLAVARRLLAQPGWFGPLNIQIMMTDDGPRLLEVNPRCGSGITLSMEAGLDVAGWMLREHLGRSLPTGELEWPAGLWLSRSRKDFFLWSS